MKQSEIKEREKPILFQGEMVQAILNGSKTQTRRLVKPQPIVNVNGLLNWFSENPGKKHVWFGMTEGLFKQNILSKCPYGKVGTILEPASYIPGCSKHYCASYNGTIYSRAKGEWRPLKYWVQNKGYQSITIMNDGRKTTRNVHRLVCSAFNGEPEIETMQVRHLDGNPQNNIASNLQWGTQYENWQDRKAHGNGVEGEKHHNALFTNDEREHIKWAIEKGLCSQNHASRILGVGQHSIHYICHPEKRISPTQDMPKEACRIRLRITDIRVERLQDITEEDSEAEGVEGYDTHSYIPGEAVMQIEQSFSAKQVYQKLWNKINGPESWAANPWVWVVKFERI